ncbi:hypothetical protein C8J56DRAFT_935038 [Mycena floridula]|nr:hypothetical protein C8J56DRAFT_935038 [Mycena floridula]
MSPVLFPESGHQMPDFQSILFKGPFHPTAPLYLSLSYAVDDSIVLFFTPSRQKISTALQQYNDVLVSDLAEKGSYCALSSRVHFLYPPTPTHLAGILSLIRIPSPADPEEAVPSSKIALPSPPSLVVLHELSSYFIPGLESDPDSHPWTVSSYISLVTRTLAMLKSLNSNQSKTSLALFDSNLENLKLPLLKQLPFRQYGSGQTPTRTDAVSPIVERFFEWTGVFEQESSDDTAENSLAVEKSLHFFCSGVPVVIHDWRWSERTTTTKICKTSFIHQK